MGSKAIRRTASALHCASTSPDDSRTSSWRRPSSPTTLMRGAASLGCSNRTCRSESSSARSSLTGSGSGQASAHFSSSSPANDTSSVELGTVSNGRATPVRSNGLPLMRMCTRGCTSMSVA
ncbi:Uncharacterised protein [Bordetella pertussis]|nr:Uncharacterised protein [Bordetella pertussis]CFW04611.1 Uncharacterised protein [Bordetella pertussis]CPJ00603.1 Uncharacterised protein [Bordetella pertussis]